MPDVHLDIDSFLGLCFWIAFVGFAVVLILAMFIGNAVDRIVAAIEQLKKDQ